MQPAQHFLENAHYFFTQGEILLSALYADTALWMLQRETPKAEVQSSLQALMNSYSEPFEHYTELSNAAKRQALQTRERAHAPFSNFLVGATLIAEDGSFHQGCNVEASSYGLTICAERTALVSAVAQGKKRFVCVVVAADTQEMTPPCGACRQMLYDFAPDALVILVNLHEQEKRFTMKELLPEAFSVAFLS